MKNLILKDMEGLAKSKGGKCLSTEYAGSSKKLKWQCKEGHVWKAIPNDVKKGEWCPTCLKLEKKDSKELKTLVEEWKNLGSKGF